MTWKTNLAPRDGETLCQYFVHTGIAITFERQEYVGHAFCCGMRSLIVHVEPCYAACVPELATLLSAYSGRVHSIEKFRYLTVNTHN